MTEGHVSILPWLTSILSWNEASPSMLFGKAFDQYTRPKPLFYFDHGHILGIPRTLKELHVGRTVNMDTCPLFLFTFPMLHCDVVYSSFLSLAKGKHWA